MNTSNKALLEIPEAAARLRICVRLYYRLVQKKQLPPILKVGRKSLVLESDVDAYIERLIQQRKA